MCWPIHHSTTLTRVAHSFETTAGGNSARRRRATPTSPGCSTSCTTLRLGGRQALCWPTAPCRPTNRARVRYGRTSSRPVSWTASSPYPASCSGLPRYRPASGFLSKSRRSGMRRDETLFIDARKLGHMLDRTRPGSVPRGHRPRFWDLSRLARSGGDRRIRRRARLLQERVAG